MKRYTGRTAVVLTLYVLMMGSVLPAWCSVERGLFSIYFASEKVGYEEYTWTHDTDGYLLEVKGKLDKPVPLILDKLLIRLDENFIPHRFSFAGSMSGIEQEISSSINEGSVDNRILISGQEQRSSAKVKRDAFLLPGSLFSPYLILTKKYSCSLNEKVELSAYIIPQIEQAFTLEPQDGFPCVLIVQFGTTRIELETNASGMLKSLTIPSQKIKVILDAFPLEYRN